MSLQSKIEAVIYASEEPVTLQQLIGLLADEVQAELDSLAAAQGSLPLEGTAEESSETRDLIQAGMDAVAHVRAAQDAVSPEQRAIDEGEIVASEAYLNASEKEGADPASRTQQFSEVSASDGSSTELPQTGDMAGEDGRRRARAVRDHLRRTVDRLIRDYAENDRGIEIREVASGYRMGTKPEYHDAVRGFVKSLKPALKLTLPALETLAVVAYKQPVTAAEISEIRGVDSAGVLGGLMTRKLIATAGRKQVIGRPMLYKTTRDFLLRFGLKDISELPSMDEFERMAGELVEQEDLPMGETEAIIEEANARGDAELIRHVNASFVEATSGSVDVQEGQIVVPDANNPYLPEQATAVSAAGGPHEEEVRQQDVQQRTSQDGGHSSTEDDKPAPEERP